MTEQEKAIIREARQAALKVFQAAADGRTLPNPQEVYAAAHAATDAKHAHEALHGADHTYCLLEGAAMDAELAAMLASGSLCTADGRLYRDQPKLCAKIAARMARRSF